MDGSKTFDDRAALVTGSVRLVDGGMALR